MLRGPIKCLECLRCDAQRNLPGEPLCLSGHQAFWKDPAQVLLFDVNQKFTSEAHFHESHIQDSRFISLVLKSHDPSKQTITLRGSFYVADFSLSELQTLDKSLPKIARMTNLAYEPWGYRKRGVG
jgi:hypothetical protein